MMKMTFGDGRRGRRTEAQTIARKDPGGGIHALAATTEGLMLMRDIDRLREWYRLRRCREYLETHDKEEAWDRLMATIAARRRTRMWRRWGGIAAMLVVTGGATLWLTAPQATQTTPAELAQTTLTQRTSRHYASVTHDGADRVVKVPMGAEYDTRLADGTHIVINAGTELSYPETFGKGKREVELIGEAYFEVAHDASAPFTVTTPSGTIEVLGTHFNVVAEASQTTVTLAEGSVRLHFADREFMMKPGEQARVSRNGEIDVRHVHTDNYTSWATGVYDFTDQTLDEITRQLSLWYGVSISIDDEETAATRYTGVITRQENLEQALNMLQTVSDLHFDVRQNGIFIGRKE